MREFTVPGDVELSVVAHKKTLIEFGIYYAIKKKYPGIYPLVVTNTIESQQMRYMVYICVA